MNYFPDKPWNVGDEFENETTGVVYRYDGTKWVATQDSDPLVEYLPLSGGELTGKLNIKVSSGEALTINNDKIKFWSSGAVALKGYTNFKDDELVTKEYVDSKVANHIPGTARYKFAEGRSMGALRDGECCLYDGRNDPTSTLAEARGLCWKGVDYNGNRPVPDQNAVTYSGFAAECVILSDGGIQMLYRINGGSHIGKDYCVFTYDKDIDTYFLGWGEECGVATSTSVSFHQSKILLIKKPELFK